MRIKPKENYKLLGTDIVLNKNKTYKAMVASNLPEYKEKGKIFVYVKGDYNFMLEKEDYIVI